jgi:hypothetical protein
MVSRNPRCISNLNSIENRRQDTQKNDTQHNDNKHKHRELLCSVSDIQCYAECRLADCRYADCRGVSRMTSKSG